MKTYKVNEIFYSLQGEGFYTGIPAVFLRFAGCNRRCAFCDTDFDDFELLSADEITERVCAYPARHIVITGGEPTLQLDNELIGKLKQRGKYLQIETNGSLPIPAGVDWVTCSPKAKPWKIDRTDELKIVYEGQDVEEIASYFPGTNMRFLQPCSGVNIKETVDYILKNPKWRLSLQTHKLIDIK